MSVRQEAAKLLKSGLSPQQVASQMQKDILEIKRYLLTQVGEGELKLTDILFSIDPETREKYEFVIRQHPGKSEYQLTNSIRARRLPVGEFRIYLACRNAERGDMYVFISDIEIILHELIKKVLISQFRDKWWQEGVPLQIRKACVSLREEDDTPIEDPFAYTTFINLREIIDRSWSIFHVRLPSELASDKKDFLDHLLRLNFLRNGVMHPIKNMRINKEDFLFVQGLRDKLDESKWRL